MTDYNKFVQLFGTFFSRFYKNLPWYEGLMKATLGLQEQVEQNLDELEKSAFRRLIPTHHIELVHVFDKNDSSKDVSLLRYNEPEAYYTDNFEGDYWLNAVDKYDQRAITVQYYRPGLDNVISIEQIVDNLTKPTLVLLPDIDYVVRYGLIEFKTEIPDQRLFLLNVKTDENWIYHHFGTLVGLKKDESSEYYKAVVNALWDCYNRGGTCSAVFGLIAAITGNAIARADETVIAITPDSIRTDKNTYPITQKPCVQAGDTVEAGDLLTDAFDILEINSLNYPDSMPGITLKRGILGEGYRSSLTFINQLIPVEVKNNRQEFKLFGCPADEKRFWDYFYDYMRQNSIDPYTVFSKVTLYDRINPYRFIVDNLLKYHFTFIQIKNINYPTAVMLSDINLKQFLPPWNGLMIQVNFNLEGALNVTAEEQDKAEITKRYNLTAAYLPLFAIKAYFHKI
jgi:hypothetical protein